MVNLEIMAMDTLPGKSFPLGATVYPDGVNFSLFSKNSTALELLLFDASDLARPARVILLDPRLNRTYHYWHIFVPGLKPGQLYAYRANGPFAPSKGLRYDGNKVLLDPYGLGVVIDDNYNRTAAEMPGDNTAAAMKSVVADPHTYDWEGDTPLNRPFSQSVIYEMHVGGFTRHPNSGVTPEKRGTYAGLVEKIPYLQDLGVTAVELLPVYQFDPHDAPLGRINYWGYAPISFFAPHHAYSSRHDPLGPLDEFRDMVKALHRAGIEVILDVVYNHTAEGDESGPTLCYRGLENETYYILEPGKSRYANFTGTGNTMNANHPIVRRLILDSLRYWVAEMHVDGFRFDLASILTRDEDGVPQANPATLWDIESDPALAGTKLIAEAWDAAGLYQVGSFVGDSWKEWNGKFRDDVRSFVKSQPGMVTRLADRLIGSPDIYASEEREPEQSVNFVACHDGFTLNDLVSYNEKHNEANNEANRDGSNDNQSWNCGTEGPTDNQAIEDLRNRQIKNFFTLNLIAIGTPMFLMGDEVRRTQGGNNNAYCQDNEISWFDWSLLDKHADIHAFVKKLIQFRLHFAINGDDDGLSLTEFLEQARLYWHGTRLNRPDWGENSHSLALTLDSKRANRMVHIMINAYWEALPFELPPLPSNSTTGWLLLVDTNLAAPADFYDLEAAPVVEGFTYLVQPRSIAMLVTNEGH